MIGDTIIVAAGTYKENVDMMSKYLFLLGNGPETTFIDGQGIGRCILMNGGGEVSGFTLTNGVDPDSGGGIYLEGQNPGHISNCLITNCIVGHFDHGVGGGASVFGPACVIEGCRFESNIAGDSGGGLYVLSASPVIKNNLFTGNSCHVSGGGLRIGGGLVFGNVFLSNHSDSFAAGIASEGNTKIFNNTLVNNSHNNPLEGAGAGIHVSDGDAQVHHNLVVGNHGPPSANSGVGIVLRGLGNPVSYCNDSWANDGPNYSYPVVAGSNNISVDPYFCDDASGDLTLAENSPCADYEGCGRIGALSTSCPERVPVVVTTWSWIKVWTHRTK